jgi:type I restriction enzyme S subunit
MSGTGDHVPKGYKQTDIGVFPEDWAIKTLGEIGEVTGAGVDKKSNPGEEPVRLVNYVDVYNRRPITSNLLSHWVTAPANKANRCSVRKGDVFFTPTSEVREDIAVSSMALEDIPDAVYSYHLVRLRCNDEVEVAYRTHAFSAKYFLDQASVLADGSGTRYVVNLPNFRRMLVALPPRDEQRRIGTLLTDVETQIATLKELITKKTNIKQGAMQELLTGKTRLPGFNGEWESKRLGEFLVFQTGYPFQSAFFNSDSKGMRLIKNRDLKSDEDKIYFSGDYLNEFIVRNGDLLVGMDGDFLPCLWVGGEALLNQRIGKVIPESNLSLNYLHYRIIEPLKEIQRITAATTVKHLSHADVENITIKIPEINEQEAIAEVLSDMDAEIVALEQSLEKMNAIRKGLTQQLLTGRIRLVDPSTTKEANA